MSNNFIKNINDSDFENEVLKSHIPVLVDFWAPWCGPCKSIAPLLENLAKDYQDKLIVAKINVDENQKTPSEFGVRGIPTLMIFKNGQLIDSKVGALGKEDLINFIEKNIS